MYFVSVGIDYGQPWRRTFGDNIVYTDWQRDNYYYAVQQQVCIRYALCYGISRATTQPLKDNYHTQMLDLVQKHASELTFKTQFRHSFTLEKYTYVMTLNIISCSNNFFYLLTVILSVLFLTIMVRSYAKYCDLSVASRSIIH